MVWGRSLRGHYPDCELFRGITLTNVELRRFVALWMVEGIPFAFLHSPYAFQCGRELVARKLSISVRDVSMAGSGRLGYSLVSSKFGTPFDPNRSDIDLFVVSARIFGLALTQAERFAEDYARGRVTPRNVREREFWTENVTRLNVSKRHGFINGHFFPTFRAYPIFQQINNTAFEFREHVNGVAEQQLVGHCSIRVYRSWDSAIHQICYTLEGCLRELAQGLGDSSVFTLPEH